MKPGQHRTGGPSEWRDHHCPPRAVMPVRDGGARSLWRQNGHKKRLAHLPRSECLNSAMIAKQVLHKSTRIARTRVKAAATTSTTPPEMCCRSPPKRAFRNVVQQPGTPRESSQEPTSATAGHAATAAPASPAPDLLVGPPRGWTLSGPTGGGWTAHRRGTFGGSASWRWCCPARPSATTPRLPQGPNPHKSDPFRPPQTRNRRAWQRYRGR
jgi:hypothetical protein